MASGYKADQYVEPTGAYGGGNQRAYDNINGKTGYKNSYGYFIPDKDTSDEYDEPSPTVNYSAPTGTGAVARPWRSTACSSSSPACPACWATMCGVRCI